ncbi:MAG TPA: MotA/TolQ/ExbB proton channel family protein [Fibrobacter sp.]|nr:MotA/TolQ/ExbB proton channel family protein [Fibrobacter sp.]
MTEISVLEAVVQILSRGGWVLVPIFLLGWFAWFLTIERYFFYKTLKGDFIKKKVLANAGEVELAAFLKTRKKGYFYKLVKAIDQNRVNGEVAVRHAMEALRHDTDLNLSKSLKTISTCASLAPMLGLLGTVSGMVHTFDVIQLFGFGNPVLLADGISEALLTTQAGLLVAFPLMLAYNYLTERIDRLEKKVWSNALVLERRLFHKEES